MSLTIKQIQVMIWILRSSGYSADEVKEIMSNANEWYPIWLEFKSIALKNFRAGINCGQKGYLGQMQIIGEIRKTCPARGRKPYEADNNLAPIFARFFNAISKYDYFELRALKQKRAA